MAESISLDIEETKVRLTSVCGYIEITCNGNVLIQNNDKRCYIRANDPSEGDVKIVYENTHVNLKSGHYELQITIEPKSVVLYHQGNMCHRINY